MVHAKMSYLRATCYLFQRPDQSHPANPGVMHSRYEVNSSFWLFLALFKRKHITISHS